MLKISLEPFDLSGLSGRAQSFFDSCLSYDRGPSNYTWYYRQNGTITLKTAFFVLVLSQYVYIDCTNQMFFWNSAKSCKVASRINTQRVRAIAPARYITNIFVLIKGGTFKKNTICSFDSHQTNSVWNSGQAASDEIGSSTYGKKVGCVNKKKRFARSLSPDSVFIMMLKGLDFNA